MPQMMKMLKYPALAVALCLTQAACTLDALGAGASRDSILPAVSRVVVVSIDGLRGDAVKTMPALSALESRAAWTDSMQTVVPSLTVPGHLSMFTGRDVTTMGVTTNTLDQSDGLSLAINGATTMFQWVKDAGGRTSALAASSLIPASDLASAQSFFGIDTITSVTADLNILRADAIAAATAANAPTLLFVHIPTVDFAGHDFGWVRTDTAAADGGDVLGTQYVDAAHAADSVVSAIWLALQPAIENGDVALVITADHGG
jgi:predicted AlkP superfamily pyrophosphatase or phosphodiesterase